MQTFSVPGLICNNLHQVQCRIAEDGLILLGQRLGENDNWIAGFCRYYGQPLVSRDAAFDRVRALRRLAY